MTGKLKETRKNNKKDFIKFIVFGIFILLIIGITIWLLPWIISLKDEEARATLQEFIYSKGFGGVFILLGIQILQVIVAFIPGEPIEVISGLLYGTWGGYFICTIGMLIGTVLIYYTVRLLGFSFVDKLTGGGKLNKFKFLKDTKKLEVITFILFFIPGTPKDLLTYFMPFTKIKPLSFFTIVTVARIPSIISSTFAGASIGDGKWIQSIVIFAIIGVVGILGIIFNERFVKSINTKKEKLKEKVHQHHQK